MKLVHENCSIECEAANVISRKIIRCSFMEIKTVGKCTTYKCKRNCEAEITKELSPKAYKMKKTSALNIADSLECEDLFLAVHTLKTLRVTKDTHTGRHNAQFAQTNAYTFAEISRQIHNIPKLNPVKPALTGS